MSVDARTRVQNGLPGFRKIIVEMRDSGDPDRLADAAFIVGLFDAMAEVGEEMKAEVERLQGIESAARALHEQVAMDESVGICLSDCVAMLRLRDALAGLSYA